MRNADTNEADPEALALAALGWTLADEARGERLLARTGLSASALRGGLGQTATLAAILRFLEGHEPDLVGCAEALGVPPLALVEARRSLEK